MICIWRILKKHVVVNDVIRLGENMEKNVSGKVIVLGLMIFVIVAVITPGLTAQLASPSMNSTGGDIDAGKMNNVVKKSVVGRDTPPVVEWQKTFGGSELDRGYSVQQTSDGGYFIVGDTASFGSSDEYEVYLIKTDDEGNVDWSKHNPGTYGYGKALSDTRYVGWQASDGGYYVAGTYQPSQLKTHVYFLKLYSNGNVDCEKYFTINILKNQDFGMAVQQTNDGKYIVTGGTMKAFRYDAFLLKVKTDCNKAWVKTYGSVGISRLGNCVQQTSDGGYIIAGLKMTGTDGDIWLLKTNSYGTGQWGKTFGGSDFDIGNCVQQTSDGGYILVGQIGGFDADVCLIKTDSSGSKQFEKHFDKYGELDIGFCVRQTDDDGDGNADDGYIIAAMTMTLEETDVDAWIIKTDSSGTMEWDMVLGGSDPDDAQSVWQTSDGGYIVTGFTRSYSNGGEEDVWLVKLKYNEPPNEPSNPDPYDGEIDVDADADLSWDGGDPDSDDTVMYDVYFGDSSPPDFVESIGPYPASQTSISYDPGTMDTITTYYWQIVAEDNHEESTEGPIWDFTTENNPPYTPSNPDPSDGATGVDVDADLSWTCSDPDGDPLTYDVYFGDTSPPPLVSSGQSATTYDPDTMNPNTQYFWQIVAWDNHGASTSGPGWDFTTENNPPNVPSNPNPYDGEPGVDVDADLSWEGGDPDPGDTVTYDVYFGDTSPPPQVAWNISDTTYDPGTMENSTKYYWQIVAWDNHGASASSPEWDFTTEDEQLNFPPMFSNENPPDGDTDVPITTTSLSVYIADKEGDSFEWSIETSPNIGSSSGTGEYNDTKTCSISGLSYDTIYTWYVNATDSGSGETTEEVYTFSNVTNSPPGAPEIDGPANGKPGTSYDFTFNAVDPEGDDVRYHVDWGDTNSDTTVFAQSGEDVTVSHTWTIEGTFTITAKAEDEFGLIGPETTKTVTMPRNKVINTPFQWFLNNHPNMFPILRLLLQRLGL